MTENYKPKVGDTVKATLGESVLYGKVERSYDDRVVTLDISDAPDGADLDAIAWHFEPWAPPMEFKPLTVVRLDDDAFKALDPDDSLISEGRYNNSPFAVRLVDDYWVQLGETDWEMDDDTVARILAAGKAEVLFAGVDQ